MLKYQRCKQLPWCRHVLVQWQRLVNYRYRFQVFKKRSIFLFAMQDLLKCLDLCIYYFKEQNVSNAIRKTRQLMAGNTGNSRKCESNVDSFSFFNCWMFIRFCMKCAQKSQNHLKNLVMWLFEKKITIVIKDIKYNIIYV